MVLGALGPWAHAQTPAGDVPASGLGHGAAMVLACAALAALMLVLGHRVIAALCAAAALAWTALVMFTLPGSLLDGPARQADLAWGSYLALLGALILLAGAVPRAPQSVG